ncbi:hypothetical protein [Streptomyces bullii]|uniref:Uncharacterized protein n=1 Tax=Streptomyces bullii TaxID=349910 RepID=A0ABW0UK68_9ACTN
MTVPETAGTAGAAGLAGTAEQYAFAEGAERIEGADVTAEAVELKPGAAYRSSLPGSGEVFYRLELDSTSNAYVSATAVPAPGATVSALDGIRVSVENADGRSCSLDIASFGAPGSPHPITAWAAREISPSRAVCREAGTYYVSVERAGRGGQGASADAWEVELAVVSEPGLREAGATSGPKEWNSASPQHLAGEAVRRPGGAGFSRAVSLGQGVWRDDIRPGQTLFYKVPVDWGQQLSVTAELGSSDSTGRGYAPHALDLALHNPARGLVEDMGVFYNGRQKSDSLAPLPPVDYANRYTAVGRVSAMRFAGSYYLVAHLAEKVADSFGDAPVALTLRVRVSGAGEAGPEYAGESVPQDVFQVTEGGRAVAAEGASAGDDTAMKAVAVGGIGTGSVLLAGLGVWTVAARRKGRVSS